MTTAAHSIRVLHVLPSLNQTYGGPVRAVFDLSARAEQYGLVSEIVGIDELNMADNEVPPRNIHALPSKFPRNYRYAPGLREWFQKSWRRFDGVILHGLWLYPQHAIAQECRRVGLPYACFPHGMLEPWAVYKQGFLKATKKLLYWHLRERKVLLGARCMYFTTQREARLASETFRLEGVRRILIPYGVASAGSSTMAGRPELVIPESHKFALFLGRIHPKKNIPFLLEAWRAANPPEHWHLVIAGSGDESHMREIESRIEQCGISNRVHMVGFAAGAKKQSLLKHASWFVLPSLQENFGIAVLEAVGSGCPAVISDQVFIAESLHPESEVLPLTLAAWVDFFQRRMPDEAWREKRAREDQSYAMEKMRIDKVSADWAATIMGTFAPNGTK